MLMSDVNLKSYSDISYHNEELKSLTRYRFDKVQERANSRPLYQTYLYLISELEKLVPTLHMTSVYAMLSEFPGAKLMLTNAHLTKLSNLFILKLQRVIMVKTAITFERSRKNLYWFKYACKIT